MSNAAYSAKSINADLDALRARGAEHSEMIRRKAERIAAKKAEARKLRRAQLADERAAQVSAYQNSECLAGYIDYRA